VPASRSSLPASAPINGPHEGLLAAPKVIPLKPPDADAIGWVEVQHNEGTYYWHTETDETTYQRPPGFTEEEGDEEVDKTVAWEQAQQVRMDEILEQNKEMRVNQGGKRGSVVWETMVGVRRSAGLRRQSVTDMYLNLKRRFVEKSDSQLLKIEVDTDTIDDQIEFYLTGKKASRKRALFLNGKTKIAAADQAARDEKERKERIHLEKEQAEAAVKAAHELEALKIKVAAEMAQAAKMREMNQEDAAIEAESWPPEDQASIWIEPQVGKAEESRRMALYQFGKASLSTSTEELGRDMGPGILLYFHLLAMLFWHFMLATVITLPAVMINMEGQGMDISGSTSYLKGLTPTMLGNQGATCTPPVLGLQDLYTHAKSVASVSPACMFCLENDDVLGCGNSTKNVCEGISPPSICSTWLNGTNLTHGPYPTWPNAAQDKVMLPFVGKGKSSTAALIIMLCDMIATLLFLKAVAIYRVHIDKIIAEDDESKISAADFSIWVTGLPVDATEEDVHKHFDERFGCDAWEYYPNHCGCIGSPQLYDGLESTGRYAKVQHTHSHMQYTLLSCSIRIHTYDIWRLMTFCRSLLRTLTTQPHPPKQPPPPGPNSPWFGKGRQFCTPEHMRATALSGLTCSLRAPLGPEEF
jgi:hypothetical protein